MAEGGSVALDPRASSAAPARSGRRFYLAMAVLFAIMIFVGFWPSYYGPLTRGATSTHWILHTHGVIYIGWMFLFVAQAALAARGRLRTHRAVGNVALGYGALVWVVGVFVSFAAPVLSVRSGRWTVDQAAAFLPIPLGDMVLFGAFLAAAAIYRNRAELHKRLMVLATLAIVFAAAFRLQNAGVPRSAAIIVWFVPLVLAMVYDWRQHGRVHGVYWIGAAAMAVALLRMPFGGTDAWLSIGRPIIAALV